MTYYRARGSYRSAQVAYREARQLRQLGEITEAQLAHYRFNKNEAQRKLLLAMGD